MFTPKKKKKIKLEIELAPYWRRNNIYGYKKRKKRQTEYEKEVNKDSHRIMIITITKIIYLYIRQKNVLSTNLWNKNKSQKKSHVLEI